MDPHQLRDTALYPFRGPALAAMAALVLFSLLTALPGIGWVFAIILWVATYKYAFEILRTSADGRDEPPEVIGSAETSTVLRFLVLQILFGLMLVATLIFLGIAAFVVLLVILTLAQPGATISLAMDGSLAHALKPSTWLAIMGRIGWPYFGVVVLLFVFQASAAGAEALLARVLPSLLAGLLTLLFTLWGLFATFRLMGVMVLQHREALGWIPEYLGIREARDGPDQGLLEQANGLVEAGEAGQARALLAEELRSRAVGEPVHDLYRRLLRQADDRAALLEHGRLYLNLLLATGNERKALELLRDCLALDRNFAPMQEEQGEALLAAADQRSDSRLGLDLRLALHAAFPRHPRSTHWATEAARLLVEKFGREQEALRLLERTDAQVADDDDAQRAERQRLRSLVASLNSGPFT